MNEHEALIILMEGKIMQMEGKKLQVRRKAFLIVNTPYCVERISSRFHAQSSNREALSIFLRKEVNRQLSSELLKGSRIKGKAALKIQEMEVKQ